MKQDIDNQLLFDFIFNDVPKEQRKSILNQINTNKAFREQYYKLKTEIDIHRYIDKEMPAWEQAELKKVIENTPKLKAYYKLCMQMDDFFRNQYRVSEKDSK